MISLDAIEYIEIQGHQYMVVSNERVDTGAGVLNAPLMPLAGTLLGLFGTPATFHLNSATSYDPATGAITADKPAPIAASVYMESLTLDADDAAGQNKGTAKVYAPGNVFGYPTVALVILNVRETAGVLKKLEV